MADIFAGVGVHDQDAAIAVTVGDIQSDWLRGRPPCRRPDRAAGVPLMPPCVSLLFGPIGRSADPHFEIAVHVEFQNEAIAAFFVRGPRRSVRARCPAAGRRGISGDPDVVVVVDIDAVLAVGPDAAGLGFAFAADETGIGRTAPGAQQLAVGIKLQNRGRGFAAIRRRAHTARAWPSPLIGWPFSSFAPGTRSFEPRLIRGTWCAGRL